MRRKWQHHNINMTARNALIIALLAIGALHHCDGARRSTQRRKDTGASELYMPPPTAESLQALAQAMGAAGFEHYSEGRALVKRLVPADGGRSDVVEHQGVIGKAGVDFPAFPSIPNTGFNCKNVPTGYYADLETDCQVFHICDTSRKISFLCPNGTIFSQSHLICDWWFKVDCASAPALYESSAEYYSNEQKKTKKITQSLSKNPNLQQNGANVNRQVESRRTTVNIPSTTERLFRHRQRLQSDVTPFANVKATARSFQAAFGESNFKPTQRTQATNTFDKNRRNLVQLVGNNFSSIPARTTLPTYPNIATYRSAAAGDYNTIKEMQVAAETASFANNNNRQFLQDYNSKTFRPYPVYNPNPTAKVSNTKSSPTLTTLYDIRDKHLNQLLDATTKRPTLVPYTKSYTNTFTEKHEPYTRPGVSLLKDFLEKEKNKTVTTTTETVAEATERSSDILNNINVEKVIIESKDNFESATKIPQTTRGETTFFTDTASSDSVDAYSTTHQETQATTETSYQERRERLMRKLSLDTFLPTEPTSPTIVTEKYYGDLPNRPGLIVPPSLTPKTLHTLAIYYATALDNLSTTPPPEESETTTIAFDEYEPIEDGLPAILSRQTINKYSKLFGQGAPNSELIEEMRLELNGSHNELPEDLTVQQSQSPLTTSPQIRELAQVFTHALSAYLQDPVQFRKVLSDIRPTHPSFGDMLSTTEESSNTEPTTTVNEEDEEILGFSDDNKIRLPLVSLRDAKSLKVSTNYPTFSEEPTTVPKQISTEYVSTTNPTTPRNPYRCCGRISASYTSASTAKEPSTAPVTFTSTTSTEINKLANNYTETVVPTTENTHETIKYAGFQNNTLASNDSPYGKGINPTDAKPLSEYIEVTNLPTAWGVDASESTSVPVTNTQVNAFESKKIKPTTIIPVTTPVYFTETESIELENEEELQRAHSQSFVTPQDNSLRQGKEINLEETKTTVKKPSEDLEAPTLPNLELISTTTKQTTTQPSTTTKIEETTITTAPPSFSSIFTSPDSEKTTNLFQWSSTLENWQSTIIDPITVNDGLSPTGPEQGISQFASLTTAWLPNTATTASTEYTGTTEQTPSSSVKIEITSPEYKYEGRTGRLLKDFTATEPAQDLTTITDKVVEKAKEIMEGMNATTTQKLMNVMKKTKSKTVRRLILLLVQTCDDDHNTTAEASKKALLEALMAVSQKDMDEIAQEEGVTNVPTTTSNDDIVVSMNTQEKRAEEEAAPKLEKRGRSLNFEPSAINSLSNPTTTESVTTTEAITETTTAYGLRTTPTSRRGAKKFITRTTTVEPAVTKVFFVDSPRAEARVAPRGSDLKTASDTRALELLRSLYTIAARWG